MQPSSMLRWTISATVTLLLSVASLYAAVNPAAQTHYLITNNDVSAGNSASFYKIFHNGSLYEAKIVATGGTGVNGIGSVATKRVTVLDNSTQQCAFVSDAGSVDVAGIDIATFTATGTFKSESTDSAPQGIGVVNNGTYVYASFTGSNTIGTFQIESGCTLTFIQDVAAAGLNNGAPVDMQVHGNILVVSFQDGSIESFNVSSGVPVSNGDLQYSTGYTQSSNFPAGVDITADGHYAIFGGTNTPPMVEVSDISSGKLTPTVVYSNIGTGAGSEAIWLSPDESLLYLSNFSSNSVTGASFDKSSGAVSSDCVGTFKGTGFMSGLATAQQSGTGWTVYVIEADQGIGIAHVTEISGSCTIQEAAGSPYNKAANSSVESVTSFPPRSF